MERLRTILRAEAKRGFSDTAVLGGLDAFLSNVELSDAPMPQGPSYRQMTPKKRQQWAEAVLEMNENAPSGVLSRQNGKSTAAVKKVSKAATKSNGQGRTVPQKDISPAYRTKATASIKAGPKGAAEITPDSSVRYLKGVGAYWAERLAKLGIHYLRDLVYLLPNRHIDYSSVVPIAKLVPQVEQTVIGTVWQSNEITLGRRMKGTESIIGDESGNIRSVWFNQPHLWKTLPPGRVVSLSGKPSLYHNMLVFESPEHELIEEEEPTHTGRLVPVYPSTEGLKPRTLRNIVKTALRVSIPQVEDGLPEELLRRLGLPPLQEALNQAHYPDSLDSCQLAMKRLAFEELLNIQLRVLLRRKNRRKETGIVLGSEPKAVQEFVSSLPFGLTRAQDKVLREIMDDLSSGYPMARLLQGDVGSGKTVVAAAAAIAAVDSGRQAVIMAPTEILAEQHFRNLGGLFGGGVAPETNPFELNTSFLDRPLRLGLLVGSMPQREKDNLRSAIGSGDVDITIGTHALIQEGVTFDRLGLVVIDEQHRFGVSQRWALKKRGDNPHLLVMSATPIPRTLALTVYGDLDVSTIDELPPGRVPLETRWLPPSERRAGYRFIREQINQGRQAFVICPLIEESSLIEAKAATEEHRRLSEEVFPDLRIGLLHGRMPSVEKDTVMGHFQRGETDILVSTSVIEVGIDIPNASVMLIEGAERFGLAQLHQFRGRVGRGQHQSYCLLFSDSNSKDVKSRLSIMVQTSDGFVLAEEDMKLRGPGDLLGTRQSGIPELKIAKLTDVDLLQLARREAAEILEKDPDLLLPEHRGLLTRLLSLDLVETDVS
ncbi:MAG: ATP-dependent DNA helicase RecG [Dehalococcoidia bacterium]|nr:ATP-dependent DNA helicase RecG [Dehalococcoidia bacterium]